MARKKLIRSAHFPYHVTARSNNREPFHADIETVWRILLESSFEISVLYQTQVHALVLMPNHFHLLATAPQEDLGIVMRDFMRSVTLAINRVSGRSGRVFGATYHWSLIDSPTYFCHALKYVYRNPVRAKLCPQAEDYPFSTLWGLLGNEHLIIPIYYPYQWDHIPRLPAGYDHLLKWINTPFKTEHEKVIQLGFRRATYTPSALGWKRTLEELGNELL